MVVFRSLIPNHFSCGLTVGGIVEARPGPLMTLFQAGDTDGLMHAHFDSGCQVPGSSYEETVF